MCLSLGKIKLTSHGKSTDFFFWGLLLPSRICLFFFNFSFLIFIMALFANLSMIILILLDTHLHTPMYFLLSCLMDLNYISNIIHTIVDFGGGKEAGTKSWHQNNQMIKPKGYTSGGDKMAAK